MGEDLASLVTSGNKVDQDMEIDITAAAEKLAECQETIFLLGKQLQAMRNPSEPLNVSPNFRLRRDDLSIDEAEAGNLNSPGISRPRLSFQGEKTTETGGESPLYGYNSHMSPSDSESSPFSKSPISTNYQKQNIHRSSSSSSSSNSMSEKQGHGFTRFFSKGKTDK
ncbi:filament-like plant protein 6 [Dendrobium catenatum]|uniref:filament-like plant protein 6 n=1 Tax=Dendrobium catenatum TaxID=906689 RepID=UPI00109F3D99|nr:filament-like plant protein 6 [Dendrobium catenatum]